MENNETEVMRVLDHKGRLRKLSDFLKCNSIHIIDVPEGEEREKGAEGLFEQIIAENFPNLGNDTDIKIQAAQRSPIKFNKSWPSLKYIIAKFTKYIYKDRVLKATR